MYENDSSSSFEAIKRRNGRVSSIDGATNRLSKSNFNVIVHVADPIFIEFLQCVLRKETGSSIAEKVKECKTKLDNFLGILSSFSFI